MTCKKFFRIAAALAIVFALATGAQAFNFQVGDNLGKMTDFNSFFVENDTAATLTGISDYEDALTTSGSSVVPLPYGVVEDGVEARSIYNLSTLYEPAIEESANRYYNGTPQLAGLVSDLVVTSVTPVTDGVTIELGAGSRFSGGGSPYTGGRFDMWSSSEEDFSRVGDGGHPWDYGEAAVGGGTWWDDPFAGTNYDTFPTITDTASAAPLLSGTFVESDPVGNPGVLFTLTLFDDGTGKSDYAYVKIIENRSNVPFKDAYLDGAADWRLFVNYTSNPLLAETVTDDPGTPYDESISAPHDVYWASRSQDPIEFTALPEPATIGLLGMGIVSLSGVAFKRRRNQ